MSIGAYIFGCLGLELSKEEKSFFSESQPWGFILFSRNIKSRLQLRELTRQLRDTVGRNIPILIDQEGGRVQRMRSPEWKEYLPALEQVKKADNALRIMYLRSRLIAYDLQEVGIDVNCAPIADILRADTHPILANRCYSTSIDEVVQVSRAVANGLIDGGVLPILKHIPGYGRAVVDGHEELPNVSERYEVLKVTDFLAFKRLADLPISMTAHVKYTDIDSLPTTISKKIIKMIRDEIEFKNLLITDDISMRALAGSISERAELSLKAGCDIVLHCNGELNEMVQIAKVCGYLSGSSKRRSEIALNCRKPSNSVNIAEVKSEFDRSIHKKTL